MRIGYLINTYPRPSHSFIRREIAALQQTGVFVHRFAMRGQSEALTDPADIAEHAATERILEAGGLRLLGSVLKQAVTHPGALLSALRQARARASAGESSLLRQLIYLAEGARVAARARTLQLDHIHAHFGTNSTRVAAYAQMLGGPGYSFTVHGPEEFDHPAGLDLGGKISAARFCVAISSFGRSQLYRWADPVDWPKVHVVHCGIDLSKWSAPQPMPPRDQAHLVAVGRFAEQKGLGLLISAFAQAWRQNPALRLSLVGDGELRPQIEARIAAEGMQQAVAILGWKDENGVRRAMDAAHALVLPSFAEGLPVVIMEAMASARPCIATYIAGIPELVRPGIDGWVVPAGDSNALAEAMLTVAATDADTLQRMGSGARKRVMTRHDITTSAQQLKALFSQHIG